MDWSRNGLYEPWLKLARVDQLMHRVAFTKSPTPKERDEMMGLLSLAKEDLENLITDIAEA